MDKLSELTPEQIAALSPDKLKLILDYHGFENEIKSANIMFNDIFELCGKYYLEDDKLYEVFSNFMIKYARNQVYMECKCCIHNQYGNLFLIPKTLLTESEARNKYPNLEKFILQKTGNKYMSPIGKEYYDQYSCINGNPNGPNKGQELFRVFNLLKKFWNLHILDPILTTSYESLNPVPKT